MNVIYPLTNKSTLIAFAGVEQKTLRDIIAEVISKPNPSDSELIQKLAAMFQWSDLATLYQVNFSYPLDDVYKFQDFLEYLANPIFNEYSDYNVAHQDYDDFKRHVKAWVEKNGFKWVPAYIAITKSVMFDENASEQETITENVTRSNENEQTAQDTLTRNGTNASTVTRNDNSTTVIARNDKNTTTTARSGTNTSTAILSSNSTSKKLSSNFPIVDYTTEGVNVDEKYADGSEKTTQESTSNAQNNANATASETSETNIEASETSNTTAEASETNNATTEASETRNGTNSGTSSGTENRTYTRKKDSTNGRTPFELQKAYLDGLTNLADEIVRSFATLLNGNMYSF